jgi:uracil-DNA glycosylase family 4
LLAHQYRWLFFAQAWVVLHFGHNMLEMENLRRVVQNCTRCPLCRTRGHAIFGEGNYRAPIVLIGEAPGGEEDRIGRPFVGPSGQLLDKILAACGFNRQQHVFITNIVRCRPPNNRLPSNIEVQACLPLLHQQIELINPQLIITLGGTALQRYMDDAALKITKVRGRWLTKYGRLVMPVYHPSALLRNPQLKSTTWADLRMVVKKYRELVDANHFSPHC